MKNKTIFWVLVLVLVLPVFVHATTNAAVIFLLIEPSARASAMGEAYVAQVDDGFAGYWNPGAMAFNRKTQFASMYSNWFGKIFNDMYYFHAAGNQYVDGVGNLGVNFTYMTYGSQNKTDENAETIYSFESYDLSIATTYASQITQNIGLGTTFKFIMSDLDPEATKGLGLSYAFDIGYKQKHIFTVSNLVFGFNLQNIGPDIVYLDDSNADPLPMNFRMGFSFTPVNSQLSKLTINADMNKVLANSDPLYKRFFTAWVDDNIYADFDSFNDFINSTEIREIVWSLGVEYDYLNLLSLRGCYILDRAGELKGPSFGAGFHYDLNKYLVKIDYSFQPAGGLQDYNQTLSVGVDF